MPSCSVNGCKNNTSKRKKEKVQYFSFPRNEQYAKVWILACGRQQVNRKTATICSLHFTPDSRTVGVNLGLGVFPNTRTLRYDAIPTEKLPVTLVLTHPPTKVIPATDVVKHAEPTITTPKEQSQVAGTSVRRDMLIKNEDFEQSIIACNIGLQTTAQENIDVTIDDLGQSIIPQDEDLQISAQQDTDITIDDLEQPIIPQDNDLQICAQQDTDITIDDSDQPSINYEEKFKALQLEVSSLRNQVNVMQSEIDRASYKEKQLSAAVNRIFTPGQVQKLLYPHERVKWLANDTAAAISLRNVSLSAYNYLRLKVGYPLPDPSSLDK